ncbi:MAG TPA: hypothetical protein VNO32_17925, partial [Candidatus Acidoferrum sp.]|nr:hypothetical protein [Candidatus Acidoferrum sp.]
AATGDLLMAAVTLTITLPDHEAQALAIVAASLGPEQFESAYQHWLNHWKANDAYSPQVEANMIDVMGEAVEKLYAALADAGFDVLSRLGPRS